MRVQATPRDNGSPCSPFDRAMSIAQLDLAVDIDEFVRQVRMGNTAAFIAVYEIFHPHLIKFAAQLVSSRDMAEDAVQSVFLNIWLKREHWTVVGGLRPYLYRSVRNYLLNEIRHNRVIEKSEGLSHPDEPFGMGVAEGGDESSLDNARLVMRMSAAIRTLPERQRTVVLLRWYDDMTMDAIGDLLGISRQAVSKLLHKAVVRLRVQLDGTEHS